MSQLKLAVPGGFGQVAFVGFVQQLKYTAGDAADARITVFPLPDRDSNLDSGVHVNVSTIDTDTAKHQS